MESFTENHKKLLSDKEWLVKVDNSKSLPYLLKFAVSDEDSTCCLLITDTKTVWAEALNTKQLLRRWRESNSDCDVESSSDSNARLRDLLNLSHTLGGISDADFDVVDSRDADLAFELGYEGFKWRWDTYLLGPKTSSEIISRQLIMPLITMTHVSFYSADPISELEEEDLEKTVDKIGRSARRSIDTHVKHTFARPRIATSLQRVSALYNLSPTLPAIKSEVEPPDLKELLAGLRVPAAISSHSANASMRDASPPAAAMSDADVSQAVGSKERVPLDRGSAAHAVAKKNPSIPRSDAEADSVTESDEEDRNKPAASPEKEALGITDVAGTSRAQSEASTPPTKPSPKDNASPPAKRLKVKNAKSSDSDSDSDVESRARSQGSQESSRGGRGVARGVRQPIKRGMKRF